MTGAHGLSSRRVRILAVSGTRPEAIKLFPVIAALKADSRFAVRLVHSGQHRDLLDPALVAAGYVPDHDLAVMEPGQSLDWLTARLLTELGAVMDAEQPDRVMVQGDTATAKAAALAACYRRIPIDHVEAGLRSGDPLQPWPEEANRKIIAALASLHFVPTRRAAEALARENVDPARIYLTGNTVIDALHWVTGRLAEVSGLASGLDGLAQRFAGARIVVATCHRRENLGVLTGIATAIRRIAERPDVAVVIPLHPNPAVRAPILAGLRGLANVALIEPLDYPHFVRLLGLSTLVLTDSGGVQEEAPALGKPVLVMRDVTERLEAVEAGAARLVGTEPQAIVAAAFALLDDTAAYDAMARAINPFGDGRAAGRIVEALACEASSLMGTLVMR